MLRILILIAAFVAVKSDNCVPRSFGQDRTVCVCNSTYCDSPDEKPLIKGQFQMYTTTEDGKRLQLTVGNFAENVFAKNIFAENAIAILVDQTEKFQMISGFGGAMTDAAALNIRSLSNDTQHQLLKQYFSDIGIRYTYCRIPIAGTDFSKRPYTYDDVPDDITLSDFSLVEEDNYKIGFIKHIQNIMSRPDTLRIFTTAWSAPAWMKTSNDIKWGFLKSEYYQLWADYWKKFFDAYKDNDIHIWGLTPGNEPFDGFFPNFTFNSMAWSPMEEAKWTVNHLQPTLSQAGYNPVYMLMDDQRFELPWFADEAFKVNGSREVFSGIAYHWYFDQYISPIKLSETHARHPDQFILMTEACKGSSILDKQKVIIGSWDRGEDYIVDIIENMKHWVIGWVDWNIALDKNGGPNWAKNFVDSPILVNPESDEFYKQPMFYAIAHFSKFVPRGSYRIAATLAPLIENESFKVVAFVTPENKIVVVAANIGNEPVKVTVIDKNTGSTMNLQMSANSFNTLLYTQ